jgi:anti-sigma-K factor RskA
MPTHEEIKADLSSFALGGLDPSEARAIQEHLDTGCAECRSELVQWEGVVRLLGLAADRVKSPRHTHTVLARIRQPRRRGTVIPLPLWAAAPLAAAAVALLALAGVREARHRDALTNQTLVVALLQQDLDAAKAKASDFERQVAQLREERAQLRSALAAAEESLAVLRAPRLSLVGLEKTPQGVSGQAHMLVNAGERRALLHVFGVPPLPEEKVYELWWITEKSGPVEAGLFRPDEAGLSQIRAVLPADLGNIQAAAVTVEPAGGVPKPTGPIVLYGALPPVGLERN